MKDIPGYEGYYQIDEHGVIISLSRPISYTGKKSGVRYTNTKVVTPYACGTNGKMKIQLYKDGKKRTFYVHRIYDQVYGK
jgi:hypothetical protein